MIAQVFLLIIRTPRLMVAVVVAYSPLRELLLHSPGYISCVYGRLGAGAVFVLRVIERLLGKEAANEIELY